MRKLSKNIAKARAAVTQPAYPLPDAVSLLQKVKYAKFDETVDLTCGWAWILAMPTRWFAGRWFCRTGWANRRPWR